jgi:bifunctional DNA-binding transcriptional regulator/antitoxin component of YhaV-PrlF toxin-antitoxin module
MPTSRDPKIRKLQQGKNNKSYYVTLPINVIRALRWREHQKLVVEFDKNRETIIIRDWQK